MEFKVGDLVKLKSGGPNMTVQQDQPDGNLNCQWSSGKKLENGIFAPDSLDRVESEVEEKRVR